MNSASALRTSLSPSRYGWTTRKTVPSRAAAESRSPVASSSAARKPRASGTETTEIATRSQVAPPSTEPASDAASDAAAENSGA